MTCSLEQLANWASDHRMWMGRCAEHSLMGVAAAGFQEDLNAMRSELLPPKVEVIQWLEYRYPEVLVTRRALMSQPHDGRTPFTRDYVDSLHATHVAYMRYARAHPMLPVAVRVFRMCLGIVDRALSGPGDRRPSFNESLRIADKRRIDEILRGRTT